MKKLLFANLLLLIVFHGQAQLSKTIDVAVPGSLNQAVSLLDRTVLTNLTLSGSLDARDFKFMRDSLPLLSVIDMSNTTIKPYEGMWVTIQPMTVYEANTLPENAFRLKKTLTEIKLPKTLKAIKRQAFFQSGIRSIQFPDSLEFIDEFVFAYCLNLTEIRIPSLVTSIGIHAFSNCTGLEELSIGRSVQTFGYMCFAFCTKLKSIHVVTDVPQVLGESMTIFYRADTKHCVLHVPMGAKTCYSLSDQWGDFENIEDDSIGFYPLKSIVRLASEKGSSATVNVCSSIAWSYRCDQSWLKIDRSGQSNMDTLTLIAEANDAKTMRSAKIMLIANGMDAKVITVNQLGTPKIMKLVAGGLLAGLNADERRSITNLVLTGTMDSRDFKTLRDSMPSLSNLDLSGVDILAYSGFYGTSSSNLANEIPQNAFFDSYKYISNTTLEAIILPLSATSIGRNAFYECRSLSEVVVQNKLRTVGDLAFGYCVSLRNIDLSKSVQTIGYSAFSNCTSLMTALMGDSLLTLGSSAFLSCNVLEKVSLGNSLTSVGYAAFSRCRLLSSIRLPETVTSIGSEAFWYCTRLRDLYVNWMQPMPISINSMTFYQVDTMSCVIHVPHYTKSLYKAMFPWSSFQKMEEWPTGFMVDAQTLRLPNAAGSKVTFKITSNTNWEVLSDQSWLKVSSGAGFGDTTIELVAEHNALFAYRTAHITIQSPGLKTRYILVAQESSIKYVTTIAGKLCTAVKPWERIGLDKLVIQGSIDASDFRTLRDSFPSLQMLDLSQTVIKAYTGKDGPSNYGSYESYEANTIPHNAFNNLNSYRSSSIKSVILPSNITSIKFDAFNHCMELDSLIVPESVTELGNSAFSGCSSLKKIKLSNAITIFPYHVFDYCPSLTELTLPDSLTTIKGYACSNCSSLTKLTFGKKLLTIGESAFSSCYRLKAINLPGALQSIDESAFEGGAYESLSIPQSVRTIATYAFSSNKLKAVYVYTNKPLAIGSSDVFRNFDFSKCTLYVPKGSKSAYQADNSWSKFVNIVEGKSLSFSEQNIQMYSGEQKTIELTSNASWTLTCSQSWLSFSQTSGQGDASITISSQTNPSYACRTAFLSVASNDSTIPNLEMVVTQYGKVKTVTATPNGFYACFTKAEIHSISNLVVKGEMDARDFKFMRDSMPQLVIIDLSAVTIKSYIGDFGTTFGYAYYMPNALPPDAFYDNNNGKPNATLTQIRLPESMVSIGSGAFKSAIGLSSIVVPNKVGTINSNAFYGCTALDSVNFGTSLLYIGQSAFCTSGLNSLMLPNTVQTIEEDAFKDANRLSVAVLPNSLTYLGPQAFAFCFKLKQVVLSKGLKTLESNLFCRCEKLTDVRIPESVTSIGNDAFSCCSSLTSITIPSQMTKIGTGAFGFCYNLKSIYAMPTQPVDLTNAINYESFYSVDKNACSLYVPVGSRSNYATAIEWKDFINIVEQSVPVSTVQTEMCTVSPNPFKEVINIHGLHETAAYRLTDLNGNVLMSGKTSGLHALSAEGLPKGMYLLRIKTTNETRILKLIKEN